MGVGVGKELGVQGGGGVGKRVGLHLVLCVMLIFGHVVVDFLCVS